ncbi:MAG: StbB family protein [Dermatophilaceae bacterium]
MKVAVINFSGNVGKSTIARHLLAPRMKDATVIAVESINSDGTDDETMRGKQFKELQSTLNLLDDVVVDVGASNVEDFLNRMTQYRGSHEDFDYFVIPAVPVAKQLRDTISTIHALSALGIPATRIRVVLNHVELEDDPAVVFASLFAYQDGNHNFTLNPGAVLRANEIYQSLKGTDKSIKELLADKTDWKAKIKDAATVNEKMQFANMLGLKRLAAGVTEEQDTVFKALFA